VQQAHCRQAVEALRDSWGEAAVAGLTCEALDDPVYAQLVDAAQQLVSLMNSSGQQLGCLPRRDDPLVLVCDPGFQWQDDPARADQVYALVNTGNSGRPRAVYCLPDSDNDGAEAPCIEGEPTQALPPPVDVAHPAPTLQPSRPVLRRVTPVRNGDG
jgi:hypothetical protein